MSVNSANSTTVFVVGVGGERADPTSLPRLGFDYVSAGGLSIGAAAGISNVHTSAGAAGSSLFFYTLVARVGYRIALAEWADLTPRLGAMVAGASTTEGAVSASGTIYGGDLDAPIAFRLTPSFNILVAPELVAGGSDKGGTFASVQGWLGIGGYL